jgi:predicted N-acyltransferase
VASAFNLLGRKALYGRYWGASEEHRFLHFNVCFYAGIDECIKRGLDLFEPGAGGEHKLVRGFEPTLTHSVHQLEHPVLQRAVREHVAHERSAIDAEIAHATENSALRPIAGQFS